MARVLVLLILGLSVSFSVPGDLREGRTRYVPKRRLNGKRLRGKPYDPAQGAKTRRNIGGLLLLLGGAGMLSESSMEIYDFEPRGSISTSPEWAFSSPVIETGSILMSRPGDAFALRQQYFHKSVVLIIKHEASGDMGIIINRPSGFNTHQLGLKGPNWNIWFGGDCEGIRDVNQGIRSICLHVRQDLETNSQEVAPGVYLMSFGEAQELVNQGRARTSDFMLFLGYCGWGRNQLQGELNVGVWKMASVDSRVLVRELRQETQQLRQLPQLGLDDGIGSWRHLYAVVDAGDQEADPFETNMLDASSMDGDALADTMLRQWVLQNLTP